MNETNLNPLLSLLGDGLSALQAFPQGVVATPGGSSATSFANLLSGLLINQNSGVTPADLDAAFSALAGGGLGTPGLAGAGGLFSGDLLGGDLFGGVSGSEDGANSVNGGLVAVLQASTNPTLINFFNVTPAGIPLPGQPPVATPATSNTATTTTASATATPTQANATPTQAELNLQATRDQLLGELTRLNLQQLSQRERERLTGVLGNLVAPILPGLSNLSPVDPSTLATPPASPAVREQLVGVAPSTISTNLAGTPQGNLQNNTPAAAVNPNLPAPGTPFTSTLATVTPSNGTPANAAASRLLAPTSLPPRSEDTLAASSSVDIAPISGPTGAVATGTANVSSNAANNVTANLIAPAPAGRVGTTPARVEATSLPALPANTNTTPPTAVAPTNLSATTTATATATATATPANQDLPTPILVARTSPTPAAALPAGVPSVPVDPLAPRISFTPVLAQATQRAAESVQSPRKEDLTSERAGGLPTSLQADVPRITSFNGQPAAPAPAVARAVVDQTADQLVTQARLTQTPGESTFSLRLNPADLGQIQIHLHATREGVTALLTVAQESVRQMIETQLPELRQRLADAGVTVNGFNVSTDSGSSRGQGGSPYRDPLQELEFAARQAPPVRPLKPRVAIDSGLDVTA